MPKKQKQSYENYILLHSGENAGAGREEMIDNLSKTMAAAYLRDSKKAFNKKEIRKLAENLKRFYDMGNMSDDAIREGLQGAENAKEVGKIRAFEIYYSPEADHGDFVKYHLKDNFASIPDRKYEIKMDDIAGFAAVMGMAYPLFIGTSAADVVFDVNKLLNDSFFPLESDDDEIDTTEVWHDELGRFHGGKSLVTDRDYRLKALDKDIISLRARLKEVLEDKKTYPEGSLKRATLEYIEWGLGKIADRNIQFQSDHSHRDDYLFSAVTSKFANYSYAIKIPDDKLADYEIPEDNESYFLQPNRDIKMARHTAEEMEESASVYGFSGLYKTVQRGMDEFDRIYAIVGAEAPDGEENETIIRNKFLGEITNVRNEMLKAYYKDSKDEVLLRIFDDKEQQYTDTAQDGTPRAFGPEIKKLDQFEAYLRSGLPVIGYPDFREIYDNAELLKEKASAYTKYLTGQDEIVEKFVGSVNSLADKINRLPGENSSKAELNAWKNSIKDAMQECIDKFKLMKKGPLKTKELPEGLSKEKQDDFRADAKKLYDNLLNSSSKVESIINRIEKNDIHDIVNIGEKSVKRIQGYRTGYLRQLRTDAVKVREEFEGLKAEKNSKYYSDGLKDALSKAAGKFSKDIHVTADGLYEALNGIALNAKADYERLNAGSKKSKENADKYLKPLLDWAENTAAYIQNKISGAKVRNILTDESIEMQLSIAENRDPVIPAAADALWNFETEKNRIRIRMADLIEQEYDELKASTINPEPVDRENLRQEMEKAIAAREEKERETKRAYKETLTAALKTYGGWNRPEDEPFINAAAELVIITEDEKTLDLLTDEEHPTDKKAVIESIVGNLEKKGLESFAAGHPEETAIVLNEWNDLHPESPRKSFKGMVFEQHVEFEPEIEPKVYSKVDDAWLKYSYCLGPEITTEDGESIEIADYFAGAAVLGFDPEKEGDIVRAIYVNAELIGAYDIIAEIASSSISGVDTDNEIKKAEILDRIVNAIEEKSDYYGNLIFRENNYDTEAVYKLRNKLNSEAEPKNYDEDKKGFSYKAEKDTKAPEKQSLAAMTSYKLIRMYEKNQFDELVNEMIEIQGRVLQPERSRITKEDEERVSALESFLSRLEVEIDDMIDDGGSFDPSKHSELAEFIQRLGMRTEELAVEKGVERDIMQMNLGNEYSFFKKNNEACSRIADSLLTLENNTFGKYDAVRSISSKLLESNNISKAVLPDGSDFRDWMNIQHEAGKKSAKYNKGKGRHYTTSEYEKLKKLGERPYAPAKKGEYGFFINENSDKKVVGRFLRIPEEALIDEALYGGGERIKVIENEQTRLKGRIQGIITETGTSAAAAGEMLSSLDGMVPLIGSHDNSKEFTEMRKALENISKLTDRDMTADMTGDMLIDAYNTLKKTARAYEDSHKSFFKAAPGYGAKRMAMSAKLQTFADESLEKLRKRFWGKLFSNEKLSEQMTLAEKNISKMQELEVKYTKKNEEPGISGEKEDRKEAGQPQAEKPDQKKDVKGKNKIAFEKLGGKEKDRKRSNSINYHEVRKGLAEKKAGKMKLKVNAVNDEAASNEP